MTSDARWGLHCPRCTADYPPFAGTEGCPRCREGGVIVVLEVALQRSDQPTRDGARGMRRFAEILPIASADALVSLGEGDTPLVRSSFIGPRLGLGELWFKNETQNPTWSFKDRYVAVSISVARAFGHERVVVSSTGNLGASVAAYAAAAGMRCVVVVPEGAPQAAIQQAAAYGADVLVTSWDGRLALFEHLALERGWFPVGLFMPRRVSNPFGVEGYKTIAHEIVETLGDAPGAMLFPCARGNGLFGTWKGFVEAQRWGRSTSVPSMIGCQPVGANSLEASLEAGSAAPLELPPTTSIAFSTMEQVADGAALGAIRASAGVAASASDADIADAMGALAQEGIFAEPSSALPIACLPRLIERGLLDRGRPVICLVTAAGGKWTEMMPPLGRPAARIEPHAGAVDRWLEEREAVHA
jgi:threonine synthase